ncbi:MAG: 2,3-dihydro-2,3-dihydroxybenzoate dehydrogenase [Gemmatimonadetes bacterium]|nr:2,3-dihydro-2,3-dihydroxybenzoate dehydrogenase [Gemmatimonadota bacterium]
MAGYVPTLANWDALLEEDYVKGQIVGAINLATPFKDELKRVGTTSGRERVYAAKVGASQGQGARAEGATMPNYGAGEYQNVKVQSKYNYAPFKITGPSEEFGSKKAFVEFGLQILQDTKEGLRLFTGRQCWGDGQGTLGTTTNNQNVGDTVITVQNAYGVAWGSLATLTTFLFKRNMYVQFGSEDNGGQGYKIASVGTTTITLASGLANAVNATAKVSMLMSANNELNGAMVFASTASFMTTLGLGTIYHGIDRALFPEWEGNVINASAALSLALIRTTRDAIYKRTDDEESNLMIGSTEMARDYEALLVAAQRFTPPNKLRGGHTVLSHDGLDFSKDSKAPIKALFFFDTSKLAWMQTRDPHWLQDGNGIMRVVPGQDAKEALLRWYAEIDCQEPRRNAILYNITTS